MTRKKAISESGPVRPGPRKLSVSLDVSDPAAFQDLLTRVVQETGGAGGWLATWDAAHPERGASTSSYNLDAETEAVLGRLVSDAPASPQGGVNGHLLGRLHDDEALRASLGSLEVMAIPVHVHGSPVGLVCLLHPSNAAALLQQTPGVYSLRLDAVEVVVQSARLLQRLLAERKWLEALVSHNADGVAVIDADGRVVGFNPAMERLSGWSVDEAVGRPQEEVLPLRFDGSAEGLVLSQVVSTTDMPLSAPAREAVLFARGGAPIAVESSAAALRDDHGRVLGWALTVRDVRARKEKERLERLFLSGVSHELQTPIAVIKGFSGLLSDPQVAMTPQQAREKAAIIHEESCRLERMVGQLLFATRVQAGGVELVSEPAAVGDLLQRVAHRLAEVARERGGAIEVDLPQSIPLVEMDVDKIEQVLTNLVENALKYGASSPERPVVMALEVKPQEVEIRVRDQGPGIPDDERGRIFHVFERGRGATRASGSGLGLFICKSIVEAHGGRIGLDTAPGGGADFYFTLPRAT